MTFTFPPVNRFGISCTFPLTLMATTTPHCYFHNSSSILKPHSVLESTRANPSLKVPELPRMRHFVPSHRDFCKQGGLREAFQSLSGFFTDHHNSLIFSPEEAYAPVLELCASNEALSQGQQVHAHLVKSCNACESVFLGTKLVFMYGKCGSIVNAEKMFVKMSQRTTFTWNAMIGAYVSNGEPLGALEVYREMRVFGVPVDACTFPSVLKACGLLEKIRDGMEIHGLAIKCGFCSTMFVANALVAMYAKCDDLKGARRLFDRMDKKEDLVAWNSIISAYSSKGQSTEALELFRLMQMTGLPANTYTFVSILPACGDSSSVKLGREIHATILKSNNFQNVYVYNALIAMYLRCGRMAKAARIFDDLSEKDNVSWNSMIAGFVQNGLYNEGVQFFCEMLDAGQKPDEVSVISIIAACGRLGKLLNGREMHAYAIRNGFYSTLQLGSCLIDMYAKCHYIDYMGRVFDVMANRDFISWATIIAGYAQNNCHEEALELFHEVQVRGMEVDVMVIGSMLLACSGLQCLPKVKEMHGYVLRRGLFDRVLQNTIVDIYGECGNIDYATRMFELIEYKDVVSWTSLISSHVRIGLANEALELFYSMKETGIEPDSVALVSMLSVAASLSALKKGKEIHGSLIRKGFTLEGSIASSLVDLYARCGALENASTVFNYTESKGLIQWTSMINAYGMHGYGEKAIELFNAMQRENLAPDHITFLALLYACSHSGLINEGRKFLTIMECEYKLQPWPEHYACLVDLLGRANRLEEAYQFVKSMPIEPTAEVWCALLGGCRIHSNTELGEIAASKLLELDPDNPGNYVLVSNVFAASGRWKDVKEVRLRMKASGVKKNPGCSWIEIGNKIHTFIARDKSHPESDEIYRKLADIRRKLEREGGYVAQTKFVLHNAVEKEKVEMLYGHSERLAIAYGVLKIPEGTPIRITKNLRVCSDCHSFCKLVSKLLKQKLIVRDANRFHHFEGGVCSCGDSW